MSPAEDRIIGGPNHIRLESLQEEEEAETHGEKGR
jgi:hypothetical protein